MVAPRQSDSDPGTAEPGLGRPPSLSTYLAELLADQQKLQTPVTRAATAHALQPSEWRADRFRELVPLTAPAAGERYAFEVDLDACSGCKACVSGCHSLNGLDPEETWRDVGVVRPDSRHSSFEPGHSSFSQTVTTACHHCESPACLEGCPVLAYEQDPRTGIVRHLDDQCIGCSYCVLKCPYDVPKYNERLGIVRKCDLCHGRLAAGEAPACAQACPTQAIKVVLIPSSPGNAAPRPGPVADAHATLATLSGTDSTHTRPTTRYVSKKNLPSALRAADADTLRPQPAHLPLVLLLVGTQLALGLLLAARLSPFAPALLAPAAGALFFAALGASVFHLGQPLRAWRVFLNLRRSWLSREAVVLGLAAPSVALAAALPHLHDLLKLIPVALPAPLADSLVRFAAPLLFGAITLTAAGVFCSAMLYVDTRRRFWRPTFTFGRMGGTVLVAALAFVSPPAAALALAAKLAVECASLPGRAAPARLQRGPLLGHLLARLLLATLAIALFALRDPALAFACFVLGELLERALYFRAVDAPKMPGLPTRHA